MSHCLICKNESNIIFEAAVLARFKVRYYQCDHCKFIQTESPYWLSEAYEDAISSIDVGILQRNLYLSDLTVQVLSHDFNAKGCFLDYGGGYGLFVRLMRDKGFNFYRQDKYCQNLFARNFDVSDSFTDRFELLTAFEVFEHLPDPIEEVKAMLLYSDNILFSTELQPSKKLTSSDDWWYFAPEGGQHISFYTKEALKYIADTLNVAFFTNGQNLHLFTRKIFKENPLELTKRVTKVVELPSLIEQDFQLSLNKIRQHAST